MSPAHPLRRLARILSIVGFLLYGVYVGVTWNEFSLLSHDEGAHQGGGPDPAGGGMPSSSSPWLGLRTQVTLCSAV